MRFIFIISFLLASTGIIGADDANPKVRIRAALTELLTILDSDKPLVRNPLRVFKFENFSSRSYLYYYRASPDFRIKKQLTKSICVDFTAKKVPALKILNVVTSKQDGIDIVVPIVRYVG